MPQRPSIVRTPRPVARTRFFPTALTVYEQCPERYYWQYIRKLYPAKPFDRKMQIGDATHKTLARAMNARRTVSTPPALETVAAFFLPESLYPAAERAQWPEDLRAVVRMAAWCLDRVPDDAEVLLVEHQLDGRHRDLTFTSKIDLVVQHMDGEIEHVDYKTGRINAERVQQVITRFTVGHRWPEAAIRTTTLYAGAQVCETAIETPATTKPIWSTILKTVREIQTATEWPARPTPLCNWCPYRERCSVGGKEVAPESTAAMTAQSCSTTRLARSGDDG